MQTIRRSIQRYAAANTAVLVTGETGTGKELVARALHAASPRSAEPFLAVNCAGIADGVLESELFGHAKGAFTGATRARRGLFDAAEGGTLFLDEIGDISQRLQVLLLRVLESSEIRPVGSSRPRRVRCRVIAATNADLDAAVAAGTYRADLLYRLRRLELHLPPLRERRGDIPELAAHFLADGRSDGRTPIFAPTALDALQQEPWPGNVRELRNVVDRVRLISSEGLRHSLATLNQARSRERRAPAPAPAAGAATEIAPLSDTGRVLRRGRHAMRRRERLAELFREHQRLSRGEVQRILAVSHGTAAKDLAALADEGFIEKVTPSASSR
ncbi:MAG: sigma 54-interacting transcriptional regulator, partial [Planctomycetota bacterium]